MKDSENNVIQYIIVRRDLVDALDYGVLATQVAHASLAPITVQLRKYYADSKHKDSTPGYRDLDHRTYDPKDNSKKNYSPEIFDNPTQRWVNEKFTKIVLEVKDKAEMNALMDRLRSNNISYTPIEEESLGHELTAIGLKPYPKSEVAPYLKDLRLLKKRQDQEILKASVNNLSISPDRLTYSVNDINHQEIDTSNRFILQVSIDYLAKKFEPEFRKSMMAYSSHGGSGNDFIDQLIDTDIVVNLHKNDPRFSDFLLKDNYEPLLKSVLPAGIKKDVIITSLEGIFTDSKNVYIYGGCHL